MNAASLLLFHWQDVGVLAFTFTLSSDELGSTFDGVDLSQFAMQQMVGQQESHFTIRPPKPGVYQLLIYVKVCFKNVVLPSVL